MFDTFTLVVLAVAGLVGVILAYAATRPDTFSFQRMKHIAAPAERVYPLIANLQAMNTWNPFVQADPAIMVTYSGPESGTGAAHTWRGNSRVGEGRISVIDAVAPGRIVMRLEMVKPMKADNTVQFTLAASGTGTNVSWMMSGRQPFMAKLMTVFIDCDKMVGAQFEKGLDDLKSIAER